MFLCDKHFNPNIQGLPGQLDLHKFCQNKPAKYCNPGKCLSCNGKFRKKVRHHCHATGKFIGAAHDDCNLNASINPGILPVFFHNLKGYDEHFIIQKLADVPNAEIECIPQNFEKYISFSIKTPDVKIVFLDSLSFLMSSLDTLARNLTDDDMIQTRKLHHDPERVKLLK